MLQKILGYLISAALIMASLWIGNTIQYLLSSSVPGSVFGMLILFMLLTTGWIKVDWVRPTSQLFIRYMVILFVPISVGLMDHFPMLLANALPIFASTVVATTIVLVLLALGLQKLLKD